MQQQLEELSLNNLFSKLEKLTRDIINIRRKSYLHEVYKTGLREAAIALKILEIDRYNTALRNPDITPIRERLLTHKRSIAIAKREMLEQEEKPAYCIARERKIEILETEADMIDAIISARIALT